jgi:hypothetical protein
MDEILDHNGACQPSMGGQPTVRELEGDSPLRQQRVQLLGDHHLDAVARARRAS